MYVLNRRGAEWRNVRARNRRRAHCAVLFIYFIIYLYFAIHFDSVIEEVDSLSPPPSPPAPTELTTLPSPAHTHTHTNVTCRISLWQEELSHRCVYYCSSSLTDRCICVSSERMLPELTLRELCTATRTNERMHPTTLEIQTHEASSRLARPIEGSADLFILLRVYTPQNV